MRCFKLLLMGGIVLALSTQAGAIAFLQPYNGPVTMKFTNWDVGTFYGVVPDPANPVQGEANVDALAPQWPPPNGFGAEDMWGVAQLTSIRGQNNEPLWSSMIPGTPEITGLFFGERDTYFDQSTDLAGNITQTIHGHGVRIAFWEDANNDLGNPPGTYPAGNTGTARRTAETVFQGATEGTLLWTLNTVPGWDATYPIDEFFTTYSPSVVNPAQVNALGGMMADVGTIYTSGPDGAPGVAGFDDDGDLIIDNLSELGSGDDVPMTGTGNSLFAGTPDDGVADWRIAFTGKPDSSFQFMVISDDPIDTTVIPEPVTMAGLLLGIGCLGRYVRRRR